MEQLSRAEQLERKRTYWKQHIQSWQETGMTQSEYCREHNLKHHQMVYWKKRFLETETDVSFAALKMGDLLDISAGADRSPLCVVINDRFKIEVRAGFDPRLLRQLIFTLHALA